MWHLLFGPENCKDGVVSAKMGDVANSRLGPVNIKAVLISKGKR